MKDEADNLTKDWVGHKIKIELIDYDDRIGLADFEVTIGSKEYFTCHAIVQLSDFLNGEDIIKPYAWFDIEESEVAKPEWFRRKELFELNNIFERDFKKFRK